MGVRTQTIAISQLNLIVGRLKVKLFEPVVDPDSWHPNFLAMYSAGNGFDMDVLQNWAEGFVDRDGKFVREFQTTFNSCFWELYIHAVLKELGLTVDFSHATPDFIVEDPPFCIEAVTSAEAKGKPPEHLTYSVPVPEDLNKFNRDSILRQANSLKSKSDKYLNQYSMYPHVANNPFIVGLAPFDCPYFMIEAQRPIEAVLFGYYVDEERRIAGEVNSLDDAKASISAVIKESGAQVPVGLFNDASHSHISAVMYSTLATKGKVRAISRDPRNSSKFTVLRYNPEGEMPTQSVIWKNAYTEGLLDGLHIFHNPFAAKPLGLSVFDRPGVNQVYFDGASGEWVHTKGMGFLVFRRVETFISSAAQQGG